LSETEVDEGNKKTPGTNEFGLEVERHNKPLYGYSQTTRNRKGDKRKGGRKKREIYCRPSQRILFWGLYYTMSTYQSGQLAR